MNRCQNWPWPVGDLLSIVWTLDQNSRQCRGQKCCFSWPPKVRFQGCIALTSVRRIRPDEAEFYSPHMALLPRIRLLEKIKGIFEEYDTRLFNLVSNYDLGQSPSKLRYRFGLLTAYASFTKSSSSSSDIFSPIRFNTNFKSFSLIVVALSNLAAEGNTWKKYDIKLNLNLCIMIITVTQCVWYRLV